MMKLKSALRVSPIKMLRFNLHYFGLRRFKIPVIVGRNYDLCELKGSVELDDDSFGVVRLGLSSVGILDKRYDRGIWQSSGLVHFGGKASLGHGSKVSCGKMAFLPSGRGS